MLLEAVIHSAATQNATDAITNWLDTGNKQHKDKGQSPWTNMHETLLRSFTVAVAWPKTYNNSQPSSHLQTSLFKTPSEFSVCI